MKTSKIALLLSASVLVFASACGGAPPTPTPAPEIEPPAAPEPAPEGEVGPALGDLAWDYLFDSVEGWYDASHDRSYNATIASEAGGLARLTESGPEGWGKTAIIVTGIDFSRGPVLTAVVADVPEGAEWKAAVTTNPYSDAEFHEVIPSSTATGEARGDLAAATGWTGVKNEILLVLVVGGEGKSVVFDSLHINYTK